MPAPSLRLRLIALMAVAILVALAGAQWHPATTLSLIVLVIGVAVVGLPHGAFDHVVGLQLIRRWAPSRGAPALWLALFLFAYLALSLALLWGWRCWPTLGLTLFLLMSVAHFGTDWRSHHPLWHRLGWGALVIASPMVFRGGEVGEIFQALGVREPAALIATGRLALLALVPLLAWRLLERRGEGRAMLIAIAVLLAGAALLNPLIYFACYFCCFHSPLHLSAIRREFSVETLAQLVRVAAPIVIVTWIAASLGYAWMGEHAVDSPLLKTTFIGLACLTVPHMIVEWLSARASLTPG
ncbi:Brp/Blh family beta-carotene 15,15'-dioxygenase [Salinicola aestuarinus]|uniref:Brp/Blh family beta-carotene 15,15'-dioxygenase n=1 Tax=Salinicola aestuarinus TaxID=1949082 RepID=UPI000DA1C858|nr:Brp/Blh family beta-carotene 15,15'-dioxygenase [Salinicola aestuarinus]